jgi:hypothetical protein
MPERAGPRSCRCARAPSPVAVLPPVILTRIALGEVITALASGDADRSSEQAITHLQTACAAGLLTMVVIDPRSGERHEVPAQYFDDRPMAALEFVSALFRAAELSEQVVVDPLYRAVFPYRRWAHGFIEPDFRAWLRNESAGGSGTITVGAETRAVKELVELFERDSAGSLTKSEAFTRLNVGKRAFERVWGQATARFPKRRQPGRKRRAEIESPHQNNRDA